MTNISALFQLLTHHQKDGYAYQLDISINLTYYIPNFGQNYISDMLIKTDQLMPDEITIYDSFNPINHNTYKIQKIYDNWYRIILPELLLTIKGVYVFEKELPRPNMVYTNILFRHLSPYKFNEHWKLIMPEVTEIAHVNDIDDWPNHMNITHISFAGIPYDHKIEVIMQGVTIFKILDADYRTALEILSGNKSKYFVGTGFRMPSITDINIKINGVTKELHLND